MGNVQCCTLRQHCQLILVFPFVVKLTYYDSSKYDQELVDAVLAKAELLPETNPMRYGSYYARDDQCRILDLMYPVVKELKAGPPKDTLLAVVKTALQESVRHETAIVDYSMPVEADIAAKERFRVVEQFLRSSTEMELLLNLGKGSRMAVCIV